MENEKHYPGEVAYRVGLDLGSASIGWSVVQFAWDGEDWQPNGIEGLGVRIFTAGTEGNVEKGQDESRAVARRMARGARRTLARRAGRMHDLFLALVKSGLLPMPVDLNKGALAPIIDQTIKDLDRELVQQGGDSALLPYYLRTKALDHQLSPHELGRALYHLGQRRGFKSNKRADAKTASDERGKVKDGIKQEQLAMEGANVRTRGELLSRENPETKRIRGRYHARDMVEHEFNAIWTAQKAYHQDLLTEELREVIHECIFYQRPLKPVDHLVGYCSLEPGRWIQVKRNKRRDGRMLDTPRTVSIFKAPRRLALADPLAQRIRLLQRLNDLKIDHADGKTSSLNSEQRTLLLENLQNGDISFKEIRKLLGLAKQEKLNLENVSKNMIGDRTAEKMRAVLGTRWDSFTDIEKTKLVYLVLKAINISELVTTLETQWNMKPEIATSVADVDLEDGYLNFSRTACEKLRPGLEAGMSLNTIREEIYGASKPKDAIDELPIVAEAFPDLKNPVVSRVLTELRKVVKAIIKEWGLPQSFTLELTRDLKKSREARKEITKNIGERTKEREKARKALIDAGLVVNPKARDIEKYLLWAECGGPKAVCPYTGRPITLSELFAGASPWDIEHIIPYSRSLDDSFANKTLCWAEFNRTIKHNKLPMELGSEMMEGFIARIKQWPSASKEVKLRRFRKTEIDGDFITSQLNDTAYATRLAGDFLAMLYGGRYDSEQMRIKATKGQATAKLRGQWGMNKLLGGHEKNRGDHRHHAVDALVIALSTPSALKRLANASKNSYDIYRLTFDDIPMPWPNFFVDAGQALENIVISRQLKGKLSGRLHEETNYGLDKNDEAIKTARVGVESLTKKDLEKQYEKDGVGVVNPVIHSRILAQLESLGVDDPAKAFKDPNNHPFFVTKDGRQIPIHKVKLAFKATTMPVGQKYRTRHVISDSNHHMAVYETVDAKGNTKWTYEIVSLLEATRRHARGEPVVNKKPGFVMTLRAGDTIMYEKEGKLINAWVRSVAADGEVGLAVHTDAREKTEQIKDKTFLRFKINPLGKMNLRKTQIDPLGNLRICRD
ncbi:MAG: type II CRISPR RNA-guided endonuclease Cas9 [Holophagaceae bacterium]|nr:type II CRISPR RNA-guided endonuclease Cas9 [Holophagaceae bacterium]